MTMIKEYIKSEPRDKRKEKEIEEQRTQVMEEIIGEPKATVTVWEDAWGLLNQPSNQDGK